MAQVHLPHGGDLKDLVSYRFDINQHFRQMWTTFHRTEYINTLCLMQLFHYVDNSISFCSIRIFQSFFLELRCILTSAAALTGLLLLASPAKICSQHPQTNRFPSTSHTSFTSMAKSKKKSNPGSNKAKTHPPADEVTGLDFLDSIPKQWKRMYPLLAYTTGMPHHCFREVQIRPFNPKETVTPEDKRGFTEWVEFYRDQDEDGELWILHNVPTYHEKPPPGSMLRGFGIPNETSQWRHTLIVKDPLPVFLEPIELPLLGWHLLRLYRDDAAWSHVQLRFQDLSLDPLIWAEMKTMMVSPIHNWAQFRVRMKKFITAVSFD